MKELEKWIKNELPNDGEWFHSGYEEFIKSAKRMWRFDMPIGVIKEILQDLYSAVSNEYGD